MTTLSTRELYKTLMEQYSSYKEGSELGDALEALKDAARSLETIGHYSSAVVVMMIVRDLVREDMDYRFYYDAIDNPLSEDELKLFISEQ